MAEKFNDNLLRMIGGQLYFQNCMTAAREMFGKSYFSLGVGEKAAVDQAVWAGTAEYYRMITPEFLEGQKTSRPMGFRAQIDGAEDGS